MFKNIKKFLVALFHSLMMISGAIINIKETKIPNTLMLVNRVIIIIYIFYRLYNMITYGI